jgi:hypothetical protein
MLELRQNTLRFAFPEVHEDCYLDITFHRTLRIPDDDKEYPLPPSLGAFPMKHIDDYRTRVPKEWLEHGGIMLPMYQCEAMWISFKPSQGSRRPAPYPFAVKIGTGKVSAVTGEVWQKGLHKKDYMVAPPQQWIDGYVVEKDIIRQFIAAPQGMGFTAEEQITGEAEHGGVQIEVYPMDPETYEKKFPKREPASEPRMLGFLSLESKKVSRRPAIRRRRAMGSSARITSSSRGATRSMPTASEGSSYSADPSTEFLGEVDGFIEADMGLAPGGKMKQQILDDPHGIDVWKTVPKSRCFVHLANSLAWEAITQEKPPQSPVTAELYTKKGYPWFELYDEMPALEATKKLAGLKSVLEMGFQQGHHILHENVPTNPDHIVVIKGQKGAVREGTW